MASIGSLVGHGGMGMPASMISVSVRVVSVQRFEHRAWRLGVRARSARCVHGSVRLGAP